MTLRALVTVLVLVGLACGGDGSEALREQPDPLKVPTPGTAPSPKTAVRAFYSGHSLMTGVPEAITSIASALRTRFEYERQIGIGSLIKSRVDAPLLAEGAPYDALVVTERHDIPYSSFHDESPRHLRALMDKLHARNPEARTLLYHTWLESNHATPAEWIAYERNMLRHWECIASSVNAKLKADGKPQRVRVLPGATAMAELIESFVQGKGGATVTALPANERTKIVFFDGAHLTPAGSYFMGLVHYAALFGASPVGAAIKPTDGVAPELAAHMQELAFEHVQRYGARAAAASERDMAQCRDYAAKVSCPAFYELRGRKPMGFMAQLRHWKNGRACVSGYEDAQSPLNPFK